MTSGLWGAGLDDWYGPATPVVRRLRAYRPDRRGRITLARWLRVVLLRSFAACLAGLAVFAVVQHNDPGGEAWLVCALALAHASLMWRCSLIRIVLRPGEIVRFGVWRHVVVPVGAVERLHRESFRGGLVLETTGGIEVDFALFDGSLWDFVYDFSRVCADAMRAHTRSADTARGSRTATAVSRRFTWSIPAELLTACAIASLIAGVAGAVRT